MTAGETRGRVKLARVLAAAVESAYPGARTMTELRSAIPVLFVQLPDGSRHHVRIISVQGREHERFES